MFFEVFEASVGVSVEIAGPVFVVDLVALEPFLEAHGAHDVVIGHGVEGVEGIFDHFFGTQTDLPTGGHACAPLAVVVEDFVVLEAPGFEDAGVRVIRFGDVVLLVFAVEEENLGKKSDTRL